MSKNELLQAIAGRAGRSWQRWTEPHASIEDLRQRSRARSANQLTLGLLVVFTLIWVVDQAVEASAAASLRWAPLLLCASTAFLFTRTRYHNHGLRLVFVLTFLLGALHDRALVMQHDLTGLVALHVCVFSIPAMMSSLVLSHWDTVGFSLLSLVLTVLLGSLGGWGPVVLRQVLLSQLAVVVVAGGIGMIRRANETALLRQAEEIARARDHAVTASHHKTRYVATISHEIRTPLTGIIGVTDLLLESPLTEEQREWVENVQTSSRVILSLTGQVLDFSRIEANKIELNERPFCLRPLIEDVVQVCCGTAKPEVDMMGWVESDVPEHLIGDTMRLQQILVNLLGNAAKFTAAGHIMVHVRNSHDRCPSPTADSVPTRGKRLIQIDVSDTGVGIPPEHIQRLFEPFMQVQSGDGTQPTRNATSGVGLGLPISLTLVEKMGGKIWVDSTLGQGTTFHVLLPLQEAAPPPATPTARATGVGAGASSVASGVGTALSRGSPAAELALVSVEASQHLQRLVAAQPLAGKRLVGVCVSDAVAQVHEYRLKESGAAVTTIVAPPPAVDLSPSAMADTIEPLAQRILEEVKPSGATDGSTAAAVMIDWPHWDVLVARLQASLQSLSTAIVLVLPGARRRGEFSPREAIPPNVMVLRKPFREARLISTLVAATGGSWELHIPRGITQRPRHPSQLSIGDLAEAHDDHDGSLAAQLPIYMGLDDGSNKAAQKQQLQQLQQELAQRSRRPSPAVGAPYHGHGHHRSLSVPPLSASPSPSLPGRLTDSPVPLPSPVGFLSAPHAHPPLSEPQSLPSPPAEPAAATEPLPFVLVAEDNTVNQMIIGRQLRKLGYPYEIVDDGEAALQRLSGAGRDRYHLALFDVHMPVHDGRTACRLVRAWETEQGAGAPVPIIALTACSTREELDECLAAGMNDVVSKPIDVEQLASKLRQWTPPAAMRTPASPLASPKGNVGPSISK